MDFIARRILFYFSAFIIAISFNFLIPRLMPGDPVDAMFAGAMGKMDPSQMDAVRAMYGFVEGPLWEQYLSYLLSVINWELGPSILLFPTPVSEVIMIGLPWTLFLAGTSMVITVILGILAGTYSATNRGKWFDSIVPPLTMVISAFPYVVSALVIFYIFGLKLKWFPLSYAYNPELDPTLSWAFISNIFYHAALPLLSMIVVGISGWLFNMRNALINVLGEDYITMAQAKGLSSWRIMIRYSQRNAILPVMTAISMSIGFILAGSLFTEVVFNYPGLGNLMLKAINARDYPPHPSNPASYCHVHAPGEFHCRSSFDLVGPEAEILINLLLEMAQDKTTNRFSSFLNFFRGNPPALIGGSILLIMVLSCICAPVFTDFHPQKRVGRPHQPPSERHWLGTTRSGRDIFAQSLYGGRISLSVAFGSGFIAMVIAVSLGMSAGYFGGKIDEWINFFTNVVLVFPQVPLLIVLAAFLGQVGPPIIALLIGLTAWPWGTRVIRAQTMALRYKEFVLAAEVMGEKKWRIILIEILPNLVSIVGGGFIGVVLYALLSQAGLEFLGLGDPSSVTWGTMLYWAQNNSSLYTGAWWDVFTPAFIIAIFGGALSLINISIDQISNPKLKTGPHLKLWKKLFEKSEKERGALGRNL